MCSISILSIKCAFSIFIDIDLGIKCVSSMSVDIDLSTKCVFSISIDIDLIWVTDCFPPNRPGRLCGLASAAVLIFLF